MTQINEMSYEQAREELMNTVKDLEAGNLNLEESLTLWKRGELLADRCQAWLDSAREALDKAQAKQAGENETGSEQEADYVLLATHPAKQAHYAHTAPSSSPERALQTCQQTQRWQPLEPQARSHWLDPQTPVRGSCLHRSRTSHRGCSVPQQARTP